MSIFYVVFYIFYNAIMYINMLRRELSKVLNNYSSISMILEKKISCFNILYMLLYGIFSPDRKAGKEEEVRKRKTPQ